MNDEERKQKIESIKAQCIEYATKHGSGDEAVRRKPIGIIINELTDLMKSGEIWCAEYYVQSLEELDVLINVTNGKLLLLLDAIHDRFK